jgi:putative NIF3 family GTP cyclohydrolase 1 type 2
MRLSPLAIGLAVLLTVSLAGMPAAAAVQESDNSTDAEDVAAAYNENVDDLPDVIKNRATNERVELTIETSDGETVTYTAITDDEARVTELREGSHDPTLRVSTDEATIREVANADNTGAAASEAYESGDIRIEGVGVVNSVTVEVVKVGHSIGSSLGLL